MILFYKNFYVYIEKKVMIFIYHEYILGRLLAFRTKLSTDLSQKIPKLNASLHFETYTSDSLNSNAKKPR